MRKPTKKEERKRRHPSKTPSCFFFLLSFKKKKKVVINLLLRGSFFFLILRVRTVLNSWNLESKRMSYLNRTFLFLVKIILFPRPCALISFKKGISCRNWSKARVIGGSGETVSRGWIARVTHWIRMYGGKGNFE